MTTAFTDRYADESWGVIDDFDSWRNTHYFQVAAMEQKLHDVGASSIE
jgi:hypothetical protein